MWNGKILSSWALVWERGSKAKRNRKLKGMVEKTLVTSYDFLTL